MISAATSLQIIQIEKNLQILKKEKIWVLKWEFLKRFIQK